MPSAEALAHFERGETAAALGEFARAAEAYRAALALGPFPQAANNLGNALMAQGAWSDALKTYQESALPGAWINASVAARTLGSLDQAQAFLEGALAAEASNPLAWSGLGGLLKDQGRIEPALRAWRAAVSLDPADPVLRGVLAYMAAFDPAASAEDILREARAWDVLHGASLRQPPVPRRPAGPRLRVGYVSPDFRTHCQALFTVPLFEHHDPERVEVVAYASVRTPDAITERLRARCALWRDVTALPDEALAHRIREDGIDVLVDLTMHMAGGRPLLFARKPAPVQAAWLAYPGTTGLSAMDFRITDPYLDPPGLPGPYQETSLRLPSTFWCYDPLCALPDAGPLPARTHGHVTFGCLNAPCKANAGVLACWGRILEAVPRSRLLVLAHPGAHRSWILDQFPDPSRVDFVPLQARQAYLETYRRIDLCLDTFPYNGHTTSLDALWMGVPVLTLVGRTVVGRAGWSQLNNLGLPDLAAWDPDAYVALAAALAEDLDRLEALRRDLRPRMEASPLMDGAAFARDLEDLYVRMVR